MAKEHKERRIFYKGKIYRCIDPEKMYSEFNVVLDNDEGLFVVSDILGLAVYTKGGNKMGDNSEFLCCYTSALEEGWIERDDKE